MAPTRRKRGMSAAAAAAAAAAQWKLGDLVLAKMKGFPAWPAMISEPEQWGLTSVKNKRLVYYGTKQISEPEQWGLTSVKNKRQVYYGTKQIAFCNYAELEAFTEEKQVNNFSGNNYQGYESREVAEEKWRRHGRKKWRNFLVITTLLLFMVGYVFYFI